MARPLVETVGRVRAASRSLVRELGFMNRHIAGTDLTASQVHALIELDARPKLQSAALKDALRLDKSATSRLVADLVERGLVRASMDKADRRARPLFLTGRGKQLARRIHRTASGQVIAALEKVTASQRSEIVEGLELYASALRSSRTGIGAGGSSDVTISSGYVPGAIGEVVALHARYYSGHLGLGAFFEERVATELAEFFSRFDPAADGFWVAARGGSILGSITIDARRSDSAGARLRWFIVDESCQGTGLGARLLDMALRHCDEKNYRKVYLTSIAGLDAARHLYETHGFALTRESRGNHWGKPVLEQRFVRLRKDSASDSMRLPV